MPTKNDLTSMVEDVAKQMQEEFSSTLAEELSRVRPVGSKKVSEADQMAEWKLMKEQPEVLAQFFADQNASVASAIKYAHDMTQKERDAKSGSD